MGTRAVYTFIDSHEKFHVYKHWDGYPAGAAGFIQAALALAWELPRFEASEFAAAFIAGNKVNAGDIYLTQHYNKHGDLDYRYEITSRKNELIITAYERGYTRAQEDKLHYNRFFKGSLYIFLKTFVEQV